MTIHQFEFLRGLAALWVFASHVLAITNIRVPYLSRGGLAVELFIILSGFVITLLIIEKREPYPIYIFRRWMRLYPLFLLALAFGYVTSGFYVSVFGNSPWMDAPNPEFMASAASLRENFNLHLLLHLLMLHGAVPGNVLAYAPLTFSGPLWSISLEWQFYLVAPFLVSLISFQSLRAMVLTGATLVALLAVEVLVSGHWVTAISAFLPLQLHLFAIGIVCAVLWKRARALHPLALAGILLAVFGGFSLMFRNLLPLAIWMVTYHLAATQESVGVSRLVARATATTAARFVGRISYGIYVLHVPVLLLLSQYVVIPMLTGAPATTAAVVLAAIALPLVLLVAHLCFLYIEKPSIDWARRCTAAARLRPPLPPPATPA